MTEAVVGTQTNLIPDALLPSLAESVARGNERGSAESRFDFVRRSSNEPRTQSQRTNPDLTEEEAERAKRTAADFLKLVLENEEATETPIKQGDLASIHHIAQVVFGLSNLEVEDLAPESERWLEFCINPHSQPAYPAPDSPHKG